MIRNLLYSSTNFRLLLAVILCTQAAGCDFATMARFSYDNATAPHKWQDDSNTTTVPFTLVDNHIILPVTLNGGEPMKFVLDSGAGASVLIDSRSTRALDLEVSATITVSGVGKGPDPAAGVIRDITLGVGGLEMQEQSLIHLPLEAIPFFHEMDDVYFDGVIGAPFFSRFLVSVDYDRMEVSFSEPGTAGLQHSGAGWQSLPLEIVFGVPYLKAEVANPDGTPLEVRLLADTGARGTVSLTPATNTDIQAPDHYYQVVTQGLSGDVVSRVGLAPSLSLAGNTLGSLPVSYDVEGGEEEADSNGLIGNEVLRRFNLVFDYPGQRLYLQPNRNFSDPLEADRSGLLLRPHGGGVVVRRVAADSAAVGSGLAEGDIITSFDGIAATPATISELKRALARPVDYIHLCWMSASVSHCEDVPLATRIQG